MLLSVTEQLQVFWENVKTWLPTIISVGTALVVALLQGLIKKSITKENFTEVATEMLNNTYSQIGNVSLEVNIKPIVENACKKFVEQANQEMTKTYEELKEKYDTQNQLLIYILKNFENNISIDNATRQEIKEYIANIGEEKETEEELNKPVQVKVEVGQITEATETQTDLSIDR